MVEKDIAVRKTTRRSPSSRVSQRRQQERQARVESILLAAIAVFARNGYQGTTMAMVAEQAALGKASLYYYFKTKKALFARILLDSAEELQSGLERALAGSPSPARAVEIACRQALAFFQRHRPLLGLYLPLMAGNEAQLQKLVGKQVAAQVAAAHAPLLSALAPLTRQGAGDPAMVQLVASFLLGLVAKLHYGKPAQLERELELFLGLLRPPGAANHPRRSQS